jgi:hypothetical protein
MITRIVLAGVLALALMIAVKDGRVLRVTGLTGVCTPAQSVTNGGQLEACRAGRLAGRPDLSRQGCTRIGGLTGTYQYWRCPAGVVSGPSGH